MTYKFTTESVSVVAIDVILSSWASADAEYYGLSLSDMLDRKRQDEHYPLLIETLVNEGWTGGIRCMTFAGQITITDGHHRLAAAIDLGQSYVPVESGYCAWDSGSWGRKDAIWF